MKIRDLYPVVFCQTVTVVCIDTFGELVTLFDSVSIPEIYNDLRDSEVESVSALGRGQLLIRVE